jgi:polysaccharide biosynthesis protein PslH
MKMEKVGRVLYISGTPLVPSKIGPARRNHHIIEQLGRFYDVTVVEAPPAFRPLRLARKLCHTAAGRCDFLPPWERPLRNACAEVTSTGAYDAIVLSHLLLRRLPLPAHVPVIGDTHNVEFDVMRRMADQAEGRLRRRYARRQSALTLAEERACAARVDLLLATSDRDRRLFEAQLGARHVEVIPNGIDIAEFRPSANAATEPVVLFTGLMSYYPNQQGVRWFLDAVWPTIRERVPGGQLVIAGAGPPGWLRRRAGDHVEVTGRVADMRPHLARAAVVVVPLTMGGGTRVKILEALAMAKPVVSTSIGAEGLSLPAGEVLLLADDAGSFARHVITALTQDTLRARLGDAGRRHVVRHFDWERIGDRLERALHARIGLVSSEAHAPLRAVTTR